MTEVYDSIVDAYEEFLSKKFQFSQSSGIPCEQSDINPMLFPHQKDIVQQAVSKGRYAIFAAFGLGKSFMQIETLRLVGYAKGGRQLIIAPLGVRQEFRRDCATLNVPLHIVRTTQDILELEDAPGSLYITHYEAVRDGKIDINLFNGVSLDEASVLRSYGSDTYQTFLAIFGDIPYRFVATACPSPNKYKEIIHYAAFLGIMDTGQALTRFFQRDSTEANNLTLYPHMEEEFYAWMHSWCIFLQMPSDLGYDDTGYKLPHLNIIYHEIAAESLSGAIETNGQVQLLNDAALGLRDASREKKNSIDGRIAKMVEILSNDPESHYILWHDLEAERHAIKAALPSAVEVFGTLDLDIRENRIELFSEGKVQYLATKPEISGSGCNFQRHCHKAIFLGIGYQFNDFWQSIHRIYRFQQEHECEVHIIYTETEREVLKTLQRKMVEHEKLCERMSEIIREHGLGTGGLEQNFKRSIGCERREVKGKFYTLVNNDCVAETRLMESDSVDLIHTSIPFGNHYEYSASYNDFGHNPSNPAFFDQMDYLTPELFRILKPGRVAAIHVKDRIQFGNVTGYGMPTVEPFHVHTILHYLKHRFVYMGMITVVTDVVRENNQTYRLGWTEQCKDGSKMGVGSPEYILLFRKLPSDTSNSYADVPVSKTKADYSRAQWQIDAHAFWRSSGDRFLTAAEMDGYGPDVLAKKFTGRTLETIYSYEAHVATGEDMERRKCLPSTFMAIAPGSHHEDVWTDVNRMVTLNGEQSRKGRAYHICPLQFDIVDRIINRFSNEGDVVFDPFGGLGTVPYRAVKLGRRGHSVELNPAYYDDSMVYLRNAEIEAGSLTLFDFEGLILDETEPEEVAA